MSPLEEQRLRLEEFISKVEAALCDLRTIKAHDSTEGTRIAKILVDEATHFRNLTFIPRDQTEWISLTERLNDLIDEGRELM